VYLSNHRISLRAPEPEDLEILFQWENNSQLWMYSETSEPFSRFQIKKYIETLDHDVFASKELRLMIEDIASHNCVGIVDLYQYDAFHRKAGLGILVGEAYRRKNYATDALQLTIDYCFNYLKLHMLYCEILAVNTESIQVFEHAGFTCSSRLKDWRSFGKGYCDVFVYQKINSNCE